jgi:hypothetical protein
MVLGPGYAGEGFKPGHDVSRLLLNAAVSMLRAGGWPIESRDFLLDGAPGGLTAEMRATSLCIQLDPASLARKLAAARSYPGLEDEVARALARYGADSFQTEWLREVRYGLDIDHLVSNPPYYEIYGERQVAADLYRQVLRYRQHVAPVAEWLRSGADLPLACMAR